jgi:hypothetical protein
VRLTLTLKLNRESGRRDRPHASQGRGHPRSGSLAAEAMPPANRPGGRVRGATSRRAARKIGRIPKDSQWWEATVTFEARPSASPAQGVGLGCPDNSPNVRPPVAAVSAALRSSPLCARRLGGCLALFWHFVSSHNNESYCVPLSPVDVKDYRTP